MYTIAAYATLQACIEFAVCMNGMHEFVIMIKKNIYIFYFPESNENLRSSYRLPVLLLEKF